jgi:hypothetical protein
MRWQQGRDTITGMITRGELEKVPASREHADLLLNQARQHVGSAQAIADSDAAGAYQLLYDAARKALAAVLENQGLRATSRAAISPCLTRYRPNSTRHSARSCVPLIDFGDGEIKLNTRRPTGPALALTRWAATYRRCARLLKPLRRYSIK